VCAALALSLAGIAHASSTGLVISQVYGGGQATSGSPSYKQDYVELFNTGSSSIGLVGLSLQYASATGNFNGSTNLGTGTVTSIAPGQSILVGLAAGTLGPNLPTPDVSGSTAASASAGKFALVSGTTALACGGSAQACSASQQAQIIDLVGYGSVSLSEGSSVAALTSATAAVRNNNGCTDTDNNASDFTVAAAPVPRNSLSALTPCNGTSPSPSPTPSPTPTPTPPPPAPTPAPGNLTPIPQIQGTGHTSPLLGQAVTTSGVVTKRNNNGFFLQDPVGDGNPATSDGIFVFTSTAPTVSVGNSITLTGTVTEFNTGAAGNALTLARRITQLNSPTAITVTGSGSVNPTVITLPATADQLEAVEGMLVTVNTQLTASQNFFQGRFGQVTLSSGGRLIKPTNVFPAGSADAISLTASNAQRQLLLDDGSSAQNPNPTPFFAADNTLRAGDTVDSITGVIDYGLSTSSNTGLASYKIHPTQPVAFTRVNQRTTAPAAVGGNLKVASFNVLNYFTTFTNGTTAAGGSGQGCSLDGGVSASNCRGADSAAEFTRQRAKIVEAISAINADVVGLMEIQNNGNTAAQNLVDALNAKLGAGTYAAVNVPTAFYPAIGGAGTGTDAIRVAMIYKPGSLTLNGNAVADTDNIHNRPPLAQTFALPSNEKFTVVVNHFKSKGSCPASGDANADQSDGQGCWNVLRTQQANRLATFVQDIQASTNARGTLVIGDLNAYGKEEPILALANSGIRDLFDDFGNTAEYSYVFDGEAGYLDHALATSGLRDVATNVVHWHINADEPSVIDYNVEFKLSTNGTCGYSACSPDHYTATSYRSSDHDPVVIGLSLMKAITGTAGRDTLVGSAGDDRITGLAGADTLTGGAGSDVFVFNDIRDGRDTVNDFTPGTDKLDLRAIANTLRTSYGASGNLVASGHVRLVDTDAGVEVRIDTDGTIGASSPIALVRLKGVSAAQIVATRDLLL
jgi:predicted extracellular nuclease